MSQAFGPKTPQDGWLLRWPQEAAGILFRRPDAILIALSVIGGIGLAQTFLQAIFPGVWGRILMIAITYSLTTAGLLIFFSSLAGDEERETLRGEDLKKAIIRASITLFLIGSFIALFGLVMPSSGAGGPRPGQMMIVNEIDRLAFNGSLLVSGAVFTGNIISPVFYGLAISRNLAPREMMAWSSGMFLRMPNFYVILMASSLVLSLFGSMMHPLAFAALLVFYLAWLHVAMREIIDDYRGKPRRAASSKLAMGF